jgi:hypothetical protein
VGTRMLSLPFDQMEGGRGKQQQLHPPVTQGTL